MYIPEDEAFKATEAVLPYAGTSGRGGSSASHEMKAGEDADGTTGRRQAAALAQVREGGPLGLTTRGLGEALGWHHGQASAALSTLHKAGLLARLADVRRGRQSVYVVPEYINGRPVAQHGGKPPWRPLEADPNAAYDEAEFVNRFIDVAARRSDRMLLSQASVERLVGILKGEK